MDRHDVVDDILWIVAVTLLIWGACTMAPSCAHADICRDPALTAQMQKACYQMRQVCDQVGCTVSLEEGK